MIEASEGNIKQSRTLLERGLEADPNSTRLHALRAMLASAGGEGAGRTSAHLRAAAASNPRQAAALGYEARYLQHWSMAPLRTLSRFSTAQLWLGWVAIIFALRALWPDGPILWIVLGYLCFVVYSWAYPPLFRKWLKRKGEL